jgi:hypothetical protein
VIWYLAAVSDPTGIDKHARQGGRVIGKSRANGQKVHVFFDLLLDTSEV